MIRPLLTVVTVCRNARGLLEPTVASVLSQAHQPLEYWIVDGASTDGTREWLATLEPHGVRWISEPDRGIADAMNKGIALATGEWLAHLHAGDAYLPGSLQRVADAASRSSADVLCGSMLKMEERGETCYEPAPERLPLDMTIHHPASWTRRSAFARWGVFDPRWPNAMDYELFLRFHQAGCRFEVVPAVLARMAGGGQSGRSLWNTLGETHRIRRERLSKGLSRTTAWRLWLWLRGHARRALQRVGLEGLVRWIRSRMALARKS